MLQKSNQRTENAVLHFSDGELTKMQIKTICEILHEVMSRLENQNRDKGDNSDEYKIS